MSAILVVDDEEMVLSVVQHALQDHGFEVLTASDGPTALNLARRHQPELVVLDINMPGMDGLEVCRRLRGDPVIGDVLILFLTQRDEVDDRVKGLEMGGDDYLPKPFDAEELVARVRAVMRRMSRVRRDETAEAQVLRVGGLTLNAATREAEVDGRRVPLTPVQLDLLYHLMAHPGEVFGAEQLLVQVWGYAPGTGDPSLVRWHMKNLRERLEEDPSSPLYLHTVVRHGYVVRAPET